MLEVNFLFNEEDNFSLKKLPLLITFYSGRIESVLALLKTDLKRKNRILNLRFFPSVKYIQNNFTSHRIAIKKYHYC